jgi:two-component system sensor histidine kinase ResE
MANPQPPTRPYNANDADANAHSALGLVGVLGNAAQMAFGRLYQSVSGKPAASTVAAVSLSADPAAVLRAANRELVARLKAGEMLNARLKAVFTSLNECVIMQDAQGRIVLINNAAEQLLGSVKNFWDSELGRLFRTAQELAQDQVPAEGVEVTEMETLGAPARVQINDRIIGAQLAAVFTPNGRRLGTVIVLRDVTREALADRLKDEFVTQVTHELRTPLTVIKGMSEVLLTQPTDEPPNRKFLEAIGRNAAVLDRMIVELLDISEISAGAFEIHHQPLILDELVLAVIKGQEARAKKQQIAVGMMVVDRSTLHIVGDDRRLRWALGHLLDNSLNYTLRGGHIIIRVGARQGERVLIEVLDSGVGISPRDLPRVFERFYRGEAKTPDGKTIDPRGLGQGLYVARSVAEAHGGYLSARTELGKGSIFTLALPRNPPAKPPPVEDKTD